MKAVIVSSVHRAGDARILHKEAATLARAGYEVVLIAQGEGAPLPVAGVRLVDLPRTTQRWRRPANWWRLWRWALRERAGIYHFHDPELLPWGLLLQRVARRPVIYDAHEDYAAKVLVRGWIPSALRRPLRAVVQWAEPAMARRLAATVTADYLTAQSLAARGVPQPTVLYNYPLLDVCARPDPERWANLPAAPSLLFVGTLGADRGLWLMLETLAYLRQVQGLAARLVLVGGAKVPGLQQRIVERLRELEIVEAVDVAGYVAHDRLDGYLSRAHIGFLAHDPLIYERNIPTKLFEYMAAGLPIVTTRAGMTAYYLERVPAGLMVDSQDPREYAQAIADLWQDPDRLRRMSRLGRQAFEERYHWESEGSKLLALYRALGDWPSAQQG